MTTPAEIGLLGRILGTFKWAWGRIQQRLHRLGDLERRVAILEKALARCPSEACPACGGREFRALKSEKIEPFEARRVHFRCKDCDYEDFLVRPVGQKLQP